MKRVVLLALLSSLVASPAFAKVHERWVAYYTNALQPAAFEPFDLLVFDSDSHPALAPLLQQHKKILGYISLGEAESFRGYYKDLRKRHVLLKANKQWKGHRIIDIRRPEWAVYVVDTLIPKTLGQGFDGIMLDTLDSPLDLEIKNPKRYAGMKEAAVRLVKTIRLRYPHILIMMNRGFEILPDVGSDIDMLMAESIYSNWPGGEAKAQLVPSAIYKECVKLIKEVQAKAPKLKVYTMDYWPAPDTAGVKQIYKAQREQGFVPYVSSINLQTLRDEPQ